MLNKRFMNRADCTKYCFYEFGEKLGKVLLKNTATYSGGRQLELYCADDRCKFRCRAREGQGQWHLVGSSKNFEAILSHSVECGTPIGEGLQAQNMSEIVEDKKSIPLVAVENITDHTSTQIDNSKKRKVKSESIGTVAELTSSSSTTPNNLIVLTCRSIIPLFTKIRDQSTSTVNFSKYSRRLLRIICEEAIGCLANIPLIITTPTGSQYTGLTCSEKDVVGVSIIRSGDTMLDALQDCLPECSVGKILIQRDEKTALPVFLYNKLPDLHNKHILLLDPMLATGGSAKLAIEILLQHGATKEYIMFVNVVSCPEGIHLLQKYFPEIRIVTAAVDTGLNDQVRAAHIFRMS